MIRFTAKDVSIEIDEPEDVVSLIQKCLAKLTAPDKPEEPVKRTMTNAERCKKYRESKKNMSNDVSQHVNNMSGQQEKENEEKERTKEKEVKEKELINTLTNVKVQTAENDTASVTEKLQPTDHEFWQFAKENANLAESIFHATGVFPVKKEFGKWINDLRDLAEAGITADDVADTVQYMRQKGLPIGSPGSLLKTARWLKNSKKHVFVDRWQQAADKIQQEFSNSSFYGFFEDPKNNEVIDI